MYYNVFNNRERTPQEKEPSMSHVVNYIVVDENTSKEDVLFAIREEVAHEDWQEGGAYHERLTWHDNKVYADYDEAREAIECLDNGWYDDHAVLFRECGNLENATTRRLEKQIREHREKMDSYIDANHVTGRKSALIGCSGCGSKISREHLRSDRCPVCGTDLRSETVLSRIEGYRAKIAEWEHKIAEEKKKLGAKAPVKWLVKYEYHV